MEIADLFVVNKADREGADVLVADLRSMQALTADDSNQPPPYEGPTGNRAKGEDLCLGRDSQVALERAPRIADVCGLRAREITL